VASPPGLTPGRKLAAFKTAVPLLYRTERRAAFAGKNCCLTFGEAAPAAIAALIIKDQPACLSDMEDISHLAANEHANVLPLASRFLILTSLKNAPTTIDLDLHRFELTRCDIANSAIQSVKLP
jgi:hypothetical protein